MVLLGVLASLASLGTAKPLDAPRPERQITDIDLSIPVEMKAATRLPEGKSPNLCLPAPKELHTISFKREVDRIVSPPPLVSRD